MNGVSVTQVREAVYEVESLSCTLPMSEWRHLPRERGVFVSTRLDGEKSVSWFFLFPIILCWSSIFQPLSLCFRVQCVLSGVHRAVLVQTVLKNVFAITEVTVIQKRANVSVMQATLEKGLYNVLSDYTRRI